MYVVRIQWLVWSRSVGCSPDVSAQYVCAMRVLADGGTVRSAVVVSSEMRRRRVAESSAQCTESAESGSSGRLAVGDGMCGHSRLAGGPVARASLLLRCCGDVAVSNDVTPFRIVATILLLRGRRQIYSFCCVTTITPQMQLDDGYLVH